MRKKNKGGRPATGRLRPYQFMAEMTADEREYISRKTVSLRDQGMDISQNRFIIKSVFRPGWREELQELRMNQIGRDKKLFWVK